MNMTLIVYIIAAYSLGRHKAVEGCEHACAIVKYNGDVALTHEPSTILKHVKTSWKKKRGFKTDGFHVLVADKYRTWRWDCTVLYGPYSDYKYTQSVNKLTSDDEKEGIKS
jgi:hypothetical protein